MKKMSHFTYPKSNQYTDIKKIYSECSGPGGLQLAEFMAEKIGLEPGSRLLDIGIERGYQTCFFAKEYGVQVVGIDRSPKSTKIYTLVDCHLVPVSTSVA